MTHLTSPFCGTKNNEEPYGDLLGRNLPDLNSFEIYSFVAKRSAGES